MLNIALLVTDRYVLNETKIPLESEQQKTRTFCGVCGVYLL
jgi:hypothetical protein